MNDTNDTNDVNEASIQAVMTAPVDTTPRAGFQDELARDLAMEWETSSRSAVAPTDERRPVTREWWSTLGAVAVALLLVGGLVIVGSRRDVAPVATVPSTPTVAPPSTGPATTIVGPAPEPTAPPSTPPSTPAPTTPPSSPPTTPVAPAIERPVGMADWPAATVAEAPLETLPHLLLGSNAEFSRAVRSEYADASAANEAAAVWVTADGPGWLMIISTPDPTSIVSMDWSESIDDAELTAQGWTTQRTWTDLGGNHSALDVADAHGVVSLHGFGITNEQLLQIARGMNRRPLPQAGWDLPSPMQPFVEANERSSASRNVVYYDAQLLPAAELSVSALDSSIVQRGWWDDLANRQTVELQPALAGGATVTAQMRTTPDGTRIELLWVQNNALVSFTMVGVTTDEVIAAANSIVEVPAQQWLDSTVEPDPNDDGCQSLNC